MPLVQRPAALGDMVTITVTVTVVETGETQTRTVPENDYFLLCTGTCYEASVQAYPKSGTHVITIKGYDGRGSK